MAKGSGKGPKGPKVRSRENGSNDELLNVDSETEGRSGSETDEGPADKTTNRAHEASGMPVEQSVAELQLRIELARLEATENERKREHERMENERKREHEKQMELLRAQSAQTQRFIESPGDVSGAEISEQVAPDHDERRVVYWQGILKALIPDCEQANVDLVSFFKTVEGLFANYNIPNAYRGRLVIPLLKSRGTALLVKLTTEQLSDYNKIKETVLAQNKLTPAEQRIKYLGAKRSTDETYGQFATRLRTLWQYYSESKGAKTVEQITELVVSDQFKETLSSEVRKYVELQSGASVQNLESLAALADVYRLAQMNRRNENGVGNKIWDSNPHRNSNRGDDRPNSKADHHGFTKSDRPITNMRYKNNYHPKECYNCHERGHVARDCPRSRVSKPVQPTRETKRVQQVSADNPSLGNETGEHLAARVGIRGFSSENELENQKIELNRPDTTKTSNKSQELERVWVKTNTGQLVSGIIDSGCEISIINSKYINLDRARERGSIILRPAMGPARMAKLVETNLCLDERLAEYSINPEVNTLLAVTPELNEPLLLTPNDYQLLRAQAIDYGAQISETKEISANVDEIRPANTPVNPTTDELLISGELNKETDDLGLLKLFQSANVETTEINVENAHNTGESSQMSEARKLRMEQKGCPTLQRAWQMHKLEKGNYFCIDDILYHTERIQGLKVTQLVLPKARRTIVLQMAHETAFGGHLGVKKTAERIRYSFFWDGLRKDVIAFVESCEHCQKRQTIRTADRIPIEPVQRPALPFQVVNVDLIGPIDPPSSGHKYVLCLVDQHTRWLEAIPLRNLTAQNTCDALLQIFMRTGLPQIIATDGGTNFTSSLTREFQKLIGTSPRISTPGRPESNGLVERLNRVVKGMLHHVIRDHPRDWHRQLPFVTWAYNEVSSSTTGYAPFRLLYGREPCGPLGILRRAWDGGMDAPQTSIEPVHAYLKAMKKRMEEAAEEAGLISSTNQQRYAEYYNKRSKLREFEEGDVVLVLAPDSNNKLFAKWTGPVTVLKRYPPHSYLLQMPNGGRRHFHADKIRPFISRTNTVGVIFESDEAMGHVGHAPLRRDELGSSVRLTAEMTNHLSSEKASELDTIIKEFPQLFSGILRRVDIGEHVIRIIPGTEFKQPHLYRIPEALKTSVDEQIEELLERNFIQPSESDFCHPVVCVKKKDNSIRLCVDYRALNQISESDRFPMEQAVELLYHIGRSQYITVLDMQKAYYQVALDPKCQKYTSFATHRGLYEWKVLPFGLKGAPATFQRIINQALTPHRNYARAYIDDVAIFSNSWEEHIIHLRRVFQTLDNHQFSVNISKSVLAQPEVKYLGHIVGSGHHRPDPTKLTAIEGLLRPTTKKELRSFLGLCNYYRNYIDKFAEMALTLTELTKKRVPSKIPWTSESQEAFEQLKAALSKAPTLRTPDISKSFIVYTDASDRAVAGCLSQQHEDGTALPIAFASAKLSDSQRKWSASEREAFAIIFALKKFEPWIFGTKIEVVTDHNPLTFLTASLPQSARLQRWALALQRFDISIKYRKGSQNANADALSRLDNSSWTT